MKAMANEIFDKLATEKHVMLPNAQDSYAALHLSNRTIMLKSELSLC